MDIFCIPSHHYMHNCIHSMIIIFTITIIQQMQKIRFQEVRKTKHKFSSSLYLFVVVVVSGNWQIQKCEMSLQWIACWIESVLKHTGKIYFVFSDLDNLILH